MSKSSASLDSKLIRLVKENKILYDYNDPKYLDFNEREVAWQKIGDQMQRPASECKTRWVNIRDINRRMIRKSIANPNNRPKLYKYYNQLSFMTPFYKDVAMQQILQENHSDDNNLEDSKVDYEDNDEVNDSVSFKQSDDDDDDKPIVRKKIKNIPKAKVNKKRDYDVESLTELDPTDKVDSFLLSIGSTLKKFSPYHLNKAKSRIFEIVQEYELEQIVSQKKSAFGESSSQD